MLIWHFTGMCGHITIFFFFVSSVQFAIMSYLHAGSFKMKVSEIEICQHLSRYKNEVRNFFTVSWQLIKYEFLIINQKQSVSPWNIITKFHLQKQKLKQTQASAEKLITVPCFWRVVGGGLFLFLRHI